MNAYSFVLNPLIGFSASTDLRTDLVIFGYIFFGFSGLFFQEPNLSTHLFLFSFDNAKLD